MDELLDLQQSLCEKFNAPFDPPTIGSKLGLAIRTLDQTPLYGVRAAPAETTRGWYIHAGDLSDAADFCQPLCVAHLWDYCKVALPFLALPPGWRFVTDENGYTEIK